jgi:hypothetical protein
MKGQQGRFHRSVTRRLMRDIDLVENKPGQCWRCRTPFSPDDLVTLVGRNFHYCSRSDERVYRNPNFEWGTMCPRCTTAQERASAGRRLNCEGCRQPLAMPDGLYRRRVCSVRCEQRYRRRRQRERRLMTRCEGCDRFFAARRDDSRFCSPACRQKAYRGRKKRDEPAAVCEAPDEQVTYLDEIAGVLHYQGTAIVPLTKFHCWQGYGNRQVGVFPLEGHWVLRPLLEQRREAWWRPHRHLFECLQCRRWSVRAGWVFCSRKCRLEYRAEQARERRTAS